MIEDSCCDRCGRWLGASGILVPGKSGQAALICDSCSASNDVNAPAVRGDGDTEVAGNLAHRLPAVGSRAYSYNEALVMAKSRKKERDAGPGPGLSL